jgi:type II restriction enzyme
MLTGNKGEWSEIYTFFKLLADKKVFSGDADLKKMEKLFYPIVKIVREEQAGKFEYLIDSNVVLVFGGDKEIKISVETFKEIAGQLFERIRNANGVFSLPEIEEFMSSIYCNSLKAKSSDKTDIKVVIHDLRTGLQHLLGFSIKSKLGSPSTLLNAGGDTTNFIYQIKGIDKAIAKEVNLVKKFQEKFELLRKYKALIEFVSPANSVFKSNLVYVDYCLPEIIGNITLLYYSSPNTTVSDIVNIINDENPLDFDYSYNQNFYEHKVKRFLTDIALGLKTSKPWKGKYEATGGYLIVKEDGDVICYHIYDKNQFEGYLFNNTKLETPSTSRHLFGNIYEKEDGQFYMKLNLQVRFL